MSELLLILVATVLVNNLVLVRFLGLCPLIGSSRSLDTAAAMSMATAFVLTLASGLSYLVHRFLLEPFDLEYLRLLAFILVIAGAVQLTEIILRRAAPLLYQVLGIYLPLITSNCAVLGVMLLNVQAGRSLAGALTMGLGAGLGFGLAMMLFAGLRSRIAEEEVPEPFRGPAIALVTAGIMSLAFMGFVGMGRV